MKVKTEKEIELLRLCGQLVSRTLAEVGLHIQPGVTTLELDKIAEEFICDNGAIPGFKGYGGFPNTLCTSVNSQVVHGIPSNKPLQDGDIISVDCGVILNGYYGDSAYTFPVGNVKPEVLRLLKITRECLFKGIEVATSRFRVGDIGATIQQYAESNGYSVVRELVGHGIGTKMHEAPEVPNYGRRGYGPKLPKGLVICIEPMINMGKKTIVEERDGWTIRTKDNLPSAHFELTVAVGDNAAELLSTFDYIERKGEA